MGRIYEALEKSQKRIYRKIRERFFRFSDLPYGVRDQLEKLKSSIMPRNNNGTGQVVQFLSYNGGEGTTTLSVNFAESLTQDSKYNILLIDGNTRNPELHKIFNIDNSSGFTDLFSGDGDLSDIVKSSDIHNLFLIPGGNIVHHPSQVFDHTGFGNIMSVLKKRFDFIIFDSSPIANFYDSVILSSHVDSVIIVVQAEKTPWYEVKRVKQILEDKSVKIAGAVLNRRRFYIPRIIFEKFLG